VHLFDPERSSTVSIISIPAEVSTISHLDPAVTPAELVFEIEAALPTVSTRGSGSGSPSARLLTELASLARVHFAEVYGASGASVTAERSVMQEADDGWCFRVTLLYPAGVAAAAAARDAVDAEGESQWLADAALGLAADCGVSARALADGLGFADSAWPSRIEPFCLALGTNVGQVLLLHPRLDEAFACYRETGKPLRRTLSTTRPSYGQNAVEEGLYALEVDVEGCWIHTERGSIYRQSDIDRLGQRQAEQVR